MNWKNEEGFKNLFEVYYNVLCNFVYNIVKNDMDAEDIVVDVFANLWKRRKTLDIEPSKLKAYLFSGVRNNAFAFIKSKSNKTARNEVYNQLTAQKEEDQSLKEDLYLFREALKRSVRQLSPKTQKVYLLKTQNGLTFEEIANELDISKRTAENHMANAISKLRVLVKDNMKFYEE